jgi:hypothetical protein
MKRTTTNGKPPGPTGGSQNIGSSFGKKQAAQTAYDAPLGMKRVTYAL